MIEKKWKLILSLTIIFAAAVVIGLAAQQKTADKVVDPVCGMTLDKGNAKITYEYKGTTYYFCSSGCKDAFVKDPEKYIVKTKAAAGQEGAAAAKTPMKAGECPMMSGQAGKGMGMQGMNQGGMMGMNCPLMGKDVEWSVVNTPDGATLTVTSKNPETVKAIQDHFAKMKEMRAKMAAGPGKSGEAGAAPSCSANCPMKTDKK